jgi:hypothetical protein
MPVPIQTKITRQKALVSDLLKRWKLLIKIEKTFDRNGIISDFKGRTKAAKNVTNIANKYQEAVDKLEYLKTLV